MTFHSNENLCTPVDSPQKKTCQVFRIFTHRAPKNSRPDRETTPTTFQRHTFSRPLSPPLLSAVEPLPPRPSVFPQ